MTSEKERMLSGNLYNPNDKLLKKEYLESKEYIRKYNNTTEKEQLTRTQIIDQWLGKAGSNCYLEPPFYADYGKNIEVGNDFYANYECIILDGGRDLILINKRLLSLITLYIK